MTGLVKVANSITEDTDNTQVTHIVHTYTCINACPSNDNDTCTCNQDING